MIHLHSLLAPRLGGTLRVSRLDAVASPMDHLSMVVAESVNAWSVSGNSLNTEDAASSLFAASLFPYLAFLYFLSRPSSKTPAGGEFGFRFLLFFVFATIPAGIYAKVAYHEILAIPEGLHNEKKTVFEARSRGLSESRQACPYNRKGWEIWERKTDVPHRELHPGRGQEE